MVKRGKKKDKTTGNSLEEVFGGGSKSGWQTSSAMMVDDGEPGTAPVEGSKSKAASQAGSVKDMDCSEGAPRAGRATTHVPGLGVVTHSCKRGDHTTKQKKRKVKKLIKAVARAGRVAVRIDTKEKIKQNKIARKNVY